MPAEGPLETPAVILAADHRARGRDHRRALRVVSRRRSRAALAVRATASWRAPSRSATWPASGAIEPRHRTYLSLNRTGLAGSAFELDDRSGGERRAGRGRGMDRRQAHDPHRPDRPLDGAGPGAAGPGAREGAVLRARRARRVPLVATTARWRATPTPSSSPPSSPTISVPRCSRCPSPTYPRARPASTPWRASWPVWVSRSSSSVAPAGPPTRRGPTRSRDDVLDEIRDAMAGGAAGLAVGRVVFQDPDPAEDGPARRRCRPRWCPCSGAGASGPAGSVPA